MDEHLYGFYKLLHSYIINYYIISIKLNLNTIKQRIHDQCLQTQNANSYVILKNSTFSRVSTIYLICSFSNGSESLNVESTPQTSLPYVRIGVTKESNKSTWV
jgi:hypothetical protein